RRHSRVESQGHRRHRSLRPPLSDRRALLGRGLRPEKRHPLHPLEFRAAQRPLHGNRPDPQGPGRRHRHPPVRGNRGMGRRHQLGTQGSAPPLRPGPAVSRQGADETPRPAGGIRVGIFEEARDKDDVIRFLKRVNQTLLKLEGDPNDPIHMKAFDKAGCLGHRVIRTPEDVYNIPDTEFPALLESHLDGWEFAVEAWIHNGKIRFLNISEYLTLGYSVFVPATPELEKYRPAITAQIEKLIKTFDIDFGFVHPEYFVTSDGEMYFGEVAYRPPGFNVFELLERVYGFSGYQGLVLAFDPKTSEEEIAAFFPRPIDDADGYAGTFGVYPRRRVVSDLAIPAETEQHPYFDFHELQAPLEQKVTKRTAFGTHWGLVYFHGDDPHAMQDLLRSDDRRV